MVTILRAIDDLSYYNYHTTHYNRRFDQVSELCWNLTNIKWIIPDLKPVYEKFSINYSQFMPPPKI